MVRLTNNWSSIRPGVALWVVFAALATACGSDNREAACATCQQLSSSGGGTGTTIAAPALGGASAGGAAPSTGGAMATGGAQASGGNSAAPTSGTWPARCTLVSGAVAKGLVAEGALLIDVREPSEFAGGAVTGAVNIPLGTLSTRLSELDASRPVVVYCRSGSRSSQAASILCDAGYAVYDLGAMSNWQP